MVRLGRAEQGWLCNVVPWLACLTVALVTILVVVVLSLYYYSDLCSCFLVFNVPLLLSCTFLKYNRLNL